MLKLEDNITLLIKYHQSPIVYINEQGTRLLKYNLDRSTLFAHFDKESSNLQLDSKERSTFSGLRKALCGSTFIKNLAIMCDALEELAHLSESLQQASISLPKAHRLITRGIEILKALKETGGDYYREACEGIEKGIFHGVQVDVVNETGRKPEINRAQFLVSVSGRLTVCKASS